MIFVQKRSENQRCESQFKVRKSKITFYMGFRHFRTWTKDQRIVF